MRTREVPTDEFIMVPGFKQGSILNPNLLIMSLGKIMHLQELSVKGDQ